MSNSTTSEPEGHPLRELLISPERGEFIKNLNRVIDAFGAEQLTEWYVVLNVRSWPDRCPLKPLEEDPQWAALEFLSAIDTHRVSLEARRCTTRSTRQADL